MGDYINPKKYTDKVVQECIGYSQPSSYRWLLPWLTWRRLGFWILKLLAPQHAACMLESCCLQRADYVLVQLIDGRQRLCEVQSLSLASVPQSLQNTLEREGGAYEGQRQLRVFKLFKCTYVYLPSQQTFKPLDAMPAHLPRQILSALDDLRTINTAGDGWAYFNTAQHALRRNMIALYGNKKQLIEANKNLLVSRHMYKPLYCIQMLEIIFMFFLKYYWLPAFLEAVTAAAGVAILITLRKQRQKIMALVNHRRLTPIVYKGWVRATSSHTLVPGDVVVLQRGKAMCDMVVLQGACLVVESMLSGEAAQVRKAAFVPSNGRDYDPDRHQSSTVYMGTAVQQAWNAEDSGDEVLAMVVRTGLNTQMGAMVRELVDPSKLPADNDPFVRDTLKLYAFACCMQLTNFAVYAWRAVTRFPQTPGEWILAFLGTLCHSAPPSTLTVQMLLTHISRIRLDRAKVTVLYSKALRTGAAVDMVCFDKTGTLTRSAAELHGVVPVHKDKFEPLQQNAMRWSNRLRQALSVCNGLAYINKTVVGVDMEWAMFQAVEARFLDRETVVLPRRPDHLSSSLLSKLSISKTLEFSSQTLRSGVVVLTDDAPPGSALLFIRGAPGIIKDLVEPSSVPADFEQVRDGYSSKSFRLMALAVGVIPQVHAMDLLHMTQQQVEAHVTHMELLCLIVLTNNIRPDSRETVSQLQDGGGIRTMMITGDYHHTAIAVARDVGMLNPDTPTIIIDVAKHAPLQLPCQGHEQQRQPSLGLNGFGGNPGGPGANAPEQGLGLKPESPEEMPEEMPEEHALEAQLSLASNLLSSSHSRTFFEEEKHSLNPAGPDEMLEHSLEAQLSVAQNLLSSSHSSSFFVEDKQLTSSTDLHAVSAKQGRLADASGRGTSAGSSPLNSSQQMPSQLVEGPRAPASDRSRKRISFFAAEQDSSKLLPTQLHSQGSAALRHTTSSASTAAGRLSHQPSGDNATGPGATKPILKRVQLPPLATPSTSHHAMSSTQPSPSVTSDSPNASQDSAGAQVPSANGPAAVQSLSVSSAHRHRPRNIIIPLANDDTPPVSALMTTPGQRHRSILRFFSRSRRDDPPPIDPCFSPAATPRPGLAGLKFVQAEGNQECDHGMVLTALAEGQVQCAVTGDAFEHTLQLGDLSLLESVMRNAVVFARMKPHQKGLVMDLLGTTGIHQPFNGQPRYIQGLNHVTLFCGDGINDLAALSAADVGMAVGTTDAVVAASLYTRQGSVAGVCQFIQASKSSHALCASLFKYMVMYQWVLGVAQAMCFYKDGSRLATSQVTAVDFQALSLAFATCLLPPLKQLSRHKPKATSTVPTFILLGYMSALGALISVVNMIYLSRQSWFDGGTGQSNENPVTSMVLLVAMFELLGPLVSLVIDTSNFCEPALRYKPITCLTVFYLAVDLVATLGHPNGWGNLFGQYEFPIGYKRFFSWTILLEGAVYGGLVSMMRRLLQKLDHGRSVPV